MLTLLSPPTLPPQRPHPQPLATQPVAEAPGWHDLWRRAGTGHPGPWGLQVRALQADHPALLPRLAALPLAQLDARNTAGRWQAWGPARPRLRPGRTPAWAFAVEQHGVDGRAQRRVQLFDGQRQPVLNLQLDPQQDPQPFYALAAQGGSLALRPPGRHADQPGTPPAPPRAHRLPAAVLPDLLARAAQAGLTLQLQLHLAGPDVHLALRPQRLQAGRHHLRIDAQGCCWHLPDAAVHTLWWLPAATPGGSPCLQLRDDSGLALATLGAAPRPDGGRPCGWQTLMADALNET